MQFTITRAKRGPYHNMKHSHVHDYHEIYYLVSGERNFTVNDNIFKISKGDLITIPSGEIHRTNCYGSGSHERIAITFDDDVIADLYQAFGREYVMEVLANMYMHIPDGRRQYVEDLLSRMLYEEESIDELSDYLKLTYFHELLFFIMRCYKNGFNVEEIDVANVIIQNAAKYIFENSEKNIGLNDVADKFGMSSSYFSKKFKAVTGFGFKEYLINVRIKKASDLLIMTNMSITEIAISSGFNDSNYFGDAFRRIKGVSPNKYRKNKGAV